jgi:Domain of unknown function (DUF4424)
MSQPGRARKGPGGKGRGVDGTSPVSDKPPLVRPMPGVCVYDPFGACSNGGMGRCAADLRDRRGPRQRLRSRPRGRRPDAQEVGRDHDGESEDLSITPDKVKVAYRFRNTTGRDISTRVAFPMAPYVPNGEDDDRPKAAWANLGQFAVMVDGKPVDFESTVKIEKTTISMETLSPRRVDDTSGSAKEHFGYSPLAAVVPGRQVGLDRACLLSRR